MSMLEDSQREDDERRVGWTAHGYTVYPCPYCGRVRLEMHANGRITCEKCNWEPLANNYAEGKPTI